MAAVYAATHRNGRHVALKLLHSELALRAELRQRFVREALAANAVAHPGVVAVIDDDVTDDGTPYLVMELLAGESVDTVWEESGRRLPIATVLTIARELCDVLAAAHRGGVIHRDIKPGNLFITEAGDLKVLDFGIASLRDLTATRLTSTGAIVGTPAFLPPEQAAGRVSQVDSRSDLWAVGATMFTLLSGRTVHEGESAQHTALLAATEPAPSLGAVLPGTPPEVVAIVDKALKLDKRERWQSADEMRDAIARIRDPLEDEGRVSPLEELASAGAPALVVAAAGASPSTVLEPPHAGTVRRGTTLAILAGSFAALGLAFIISSQAPEESAPATSSASEVRTPPSSASTEGSAATNAELPTETAAPVAPPATSARASRQPQTRSSAKASSGAPGTPRKDCQPYVIDVNGKKVWKPECL